MSLTASWCALGSCFVPAQLHCTSIFYHLRTRDLVEKCPTLQSGHIARMIINIRPIRAVDYNFSLQIENICFEKLFFCFIRYITNITFLYTIFLQLILNKLLANCCNNLNKSGLSLWYYARIHLRMAYLFLLTQDYGTARGLLGEECLWQDQIHRTALVLHLWLIHCIALSDTISCWLLSPVVWDFMVQYL